MIAAPALTGPRPEESEIARKCVADGGHRGEPGEQHHPADFEAHKLAEGRVRVEVGAAGAVEQRADFGEAQDDQPGRQSGCQICR